MLGRHRATLCDRKGHRYPPDRGNVVRNFPTCIRCGKASRPPAGARPKPTSVIATPWTR